jgi:hypothetical protein
MFRELREAWRIVRIAKEDGYKGPFVVLREPMLEEMQAVYGRAIAENVMYPKVVEDAINGHPVCKYCEDYKECSHEKSCTDFMLKFPDREAAAEAFNACYQDCAKKCGGQCDGNCGQDH